MSRLLAARVAKLEARHRNDETKVLGILNYSDGQGWPQWDGVHRPGVQVIYVIGGTRTPREEWPERCRQQQNQLMAELAGYAAQLNEDNPQDAASEIVGTNHLAPLPKGKKRPRYVEIHGREIDAFNITRN